MQKNQRKLKNLIINPKFQLKYIFWISFSGLSLIILQSFIFYRYTKENYTFLVEMVDMTEQAKLQLDSELNQIIITLIILSFSFLGILTIFGLFFSHKVAGPLYKFNLVMNKIRNGDDSLRVHLRPGDEFHEIADSFNKLMDNINANYEKRS